MTADSLRARIEDDALTGGRFRELPEHYGVDDTRVEQIVDEVDDPEDRRLWWAAVQKALNDAG